MTGAGRELPSPESVGYETDPDLTVRENVERALEALAGHLDYIPEDVAEEFVWKHGPAGAPQSVAHTRASTDDAADGGGTVGLAAFADDGPPPDTPD